MFIKDFKSALGSYGHSMKLISELKLWKFFFVPILISLLVGIVLIWAAWALSDNVGDYIASYWPFGFWENAIDTISTYLGGLLLLVVGLLVYKHLVMAFAAPFMTPVSEKIEMHLTGRELDQTDSKEEYIAALMRGLRINLRNLIFELLLSLPLLILGIIPVINIITGFLLFYIQAYYSGFGNMDYTLERHRDFQGTVKFVKKNRGIAVGNGTGYLLLLLVPVFGICLALPLSTAAATIDTVKRLNEK